MYKHYTVSYTLKKDDCVLHFNSEAEACEYLGVVRCSVASCYHKNVKCKGFTIERGEITTHQETKTRLHKIWSSMHERCENVNHKYYKHYGGRGIHVCEEWEDYVNFRDWAVSNGYSDNLTIDRINNDGNYEPSNCRWSTFSEQAKNKRTNHFVTVNGEKMILSDCARRYGIPKSTVRWRAEHSRDILTGEKL